MKSLTELEEMSFSARKQLSELKAKGRSSAKLEKQIFNINQVMIAIKDHGWDEARFTKELADVTLFAEKTEAIREEAIRNMPKDGRIHKELVAAYNKESGLNDAMKKIKFLNEILYVK